MRVARHPFLGPLLRIRRPRPHPCRSERLRETPVSYGSRSPSADPLGPVLGNGAGYQRCPMSSVQCPSGDTIHSRQQQQKQRRWSSLVSDWSPLSGEAGPGPRTPNQGCGNLFRWGCSSTPTWVRNWTKSAEKSFF